MSIQSIKGGLWVPGDLTRITPNGNALLLDAASTDKYCAVFEWPQSGNVKKVTLSAGSGATLPTNGLLVQFETVQATDGLPSGTLVDANATYTVTSWTQSALNTITFANAFAVTRGSLAALVVKPVNTSDSNTWAIRINASSVAGNVLGFPYCAHDPGTGWAKQIYAPIMAVEYIDGSNNPVYYGMAGVLPGSVTQETYNSGERGLSFTLPFGCTIRGVWFNHNPGTASADFDIFLYEGNNTTPLTNGSIACDADIDQGANSAVGASFFYRQFPDAITLTANTAYSLTLAPSSTGNVTLESVTCASNDALDQMDLGKTCYKISRATKQSGNFTAANTIRYAMGLIISGIETGGGGSGGSYGY